MCLSESLKQLIKNINLTQISDNKNSIKNPILPNFKIHFGFGVTENEH